MEAVPGDNRALAMCISKNVSAFYAHSPNMLSSTLIFIILLFLLCALAPRLQPTVFQLVADASRPCRTFPGAPDAHSLCILSISQLDFLTPLHNTPSARRLYECPR